MWSLAFDELLSQGGLQGALGTACPAQGDARKTTDHGGWPIPMCDSGSSWLLPLHRGRGVRPARFSSPRAGARCVNLWLPRRIVAFPPSHIAMPVPSALAGHSQRTAPLPHVSEAPGHEGCEWEASLGNQWVTAGFSFRSNSPRALVLAWSHSLPCLLLQPLLCDPLKLVQTL